MCRGGHILRQIQTLVLRVHPRVVPIPIPVAGNAADTTKSAGIGVGDYASL